MGRKRVTREDVETGDYSVSTCTVMCTLAQREKINEMAKKEGRTRGGMSKLLIDFAITNWKEK